MEVKRELDFNDLDNFFWSGAKDRWDDATDDQKERVWERLNEWFSDEIPTETEINDTVWFECDDIFFEENEDEDMDESIQRRRRNLRRVIESRRARAKKESLRDLFWIEKSSNIYSSEEYVDSIEKGILIAKDFVTRKYSNRPSPVYVVKVFSGSRFSPKLHFVATNAKKGNIEIDEPIDFFAGTTDRKFDEPID